MPKATDNLIVVDRRNHFQEILPLSVLLAKNPRAMVSDFMDSDVSGIPLILQKMGIDPALAGGVLLTTVTDVVGFMAFLGLATLFLM